MKKILAILVAVGLLAGAVLFIGRSGAGTAELSLTFVGFETNGAAKFVVSNHSSREIAYVGPSLEHPAKRGSHFPALKPGSYREELLWPPKQKTEWRAALIYWRPPQFIGNLRRWLSEKHVPFMQPPDPQVTVWSGRVPPLR